MFERFTERARQVVVFAQDEARELQHDYIGTEHLLLGLLRDEHVLAARILDSFDVTLEEARAQVVRVVGLGGETPPGPMPFTSRAKKVLELSLQEALSLGHQYIGTEHILLGIVRETESVGARILADFDVDADTVRNEVVRVLGRGHGARRPAAFEGEAALEGEAMASVEFGPDDAVTRNLRIALIAAIALATAAFPLGLLFGWLIWD